MTSGQWWYDIHTMARRKRPTYVCDLPVSTLFRAGNCWYILQRKCEGSVYVKSMDVYNGKSTVGKTGSAHISSHTEVTEIYHTPA